LSDNGKETNQTRDIREVMAYESEKIIHCREFEELLTDYLDGALESSMHRAAAAHALRCPLCHSLLNEVKGALEVCREISAPKPQITRLEARILASTTPESSLSCTDFEDHLTDYLDGFLPAAVFHRWERHAVLCNECTDLPGEVVRAIGACYTYKTDEMPLPEGLHARILRKTIGTARAAERKASVGSRIEEWIRSIKFPVSLPQLAPVAMMLLFAVMILTQTVSADGTLSGMYEKSFELAGQTYRESASVLLPQQQTAPPNSAMEPIRGTYVDHEENK
jgi:anti-sigma factor RsiW